jgi:putative hydrolase of HD superfamily
MSNIKTLLDFVKFTIAFKKIKRDIPQSSGFIKENNSEHSYQLAMVSWYIANIEKSDLSIEKILKYALIHDLPEVYAGDTPLYSSNEDYLKSKKDREEKSILKIKSIFPNFLDLNLWLQKYDKGEDEESKFVYAVDKLLPIVSIYLDKGYAWKTHKIDIDSLVKKNRERVRVSSVVSRYFDLMILAIQEDKELFDTSPVIFKEAVTHEKERYDLHHVDTNNFDELQDDLKLKAHAVCLCGGKMLLVNHPEWDIWSIPGGTREKGESIEKTLIREIMEETNCRVVDFTPIAYQKIISPNGDKFHYRLQYLCNVVPFGDFKEDVAGNIDKIKWIEPNNFEEYIEDKEFKKMTIRRAFKYLKNENRKN